MQLRNILSYFAIFFSSVNGFIINGTRSSSKKGVAVYSKTFMCGDFDILNGVSWFYNWGINPDMSGCGRQKNFVPMLWSFYGPPNLAGFDTVLGFNEPNFGGQSNISPKDAAKYWIQVQNAYPDKTLVAPCPAPGGSNMDPFSWYDQFFDACRSLGCKVDYIATHSYSGSAENDVKYLKDLYKRYGKKVWFTEFAVPNTDKQGTVFDYMGSMLWHLENMEEVWRYSWFKERWGNNQERIEVENPHNGTEKWYLDKVNSLFIPGTQQLSPIGKFYNEFTL